MVEYKKKHIYLVWQRKYNLKNCCSGALRITGLFTLRRSSGSAYGFARSFALLIPTQNLRHILAALKMLRIFLFGRSKRRKQPERYTTLPQKLVENILKNIDKK
jgi:hypothetical protein